MYIVLCCLSVFLGLYLSIYGSKRTIVIKFSYSFWAWIEPVLMSMVLFLLFFVVELILANRIANRMNVNNYLVMLIKKFFDNGMGVLIFCAIMSLAFEKMVEKLNLDYLEQYSEQISKVCLSLIVIFGCSTIMFKLPSFNLGTDEDEMIINRILMWVLTAVGTWIGLGFSCKGRIEKENRLRKKIVTPTDKKEKIKFWIPIICPLLLCMSILFVFAFCDELTLLKYEKYLVILSLLFVTSGLVSLLILVRIWNPSEKNSIKDFYKVISAYDKGKIIKKHFGLNQYSIHDDVLIIEKIPIEYPMHENEVESCGLFSELIVEVDKNNFDELLALLKKRNQDQKEFIKNGFENCVEEMKNKQLHHI